MLISLPLYLADFFAQELETEILFDSLNNQI